MNLIREYLETANILAQMEEDDFENEDLVLVFNQSACLMVTNPSTLSHFSELQRTFP